MNKTNGQPNRIPFIVTIGVILIGLIISGRAEAGGITTDWYAKAIAYDNSRGTYDVSRADGGTLAWGESYNQRMHINLYEAYGEALYEFACNHIDWWYSCVRR